MRAFKKLMAATIATAMAATMATSAFAAELNADNKMVLSEGETYTAAGQTTVLVVPAANWVSNAVTALEDADILYIDQWETAADAQDAIAAGLGVKLENDELAEGDYYVLFGGNTGAEGAFAISAFKCTISNEPETPSLKKGDVDGSGVVNENDAIRILDYCIELVTLTEAELAAADVDASGVVNENDAIDILDYCIELPSFTGGTK